MGSRARSAVATVRISDQDPSMVMLIESMQPSAVRVVRRHLRHSFLVTESKNAEILFRDGGVVSTRDAARMLGPRVGPVTGITFSVERGFPPNVIVWTALTDDGVIVTGKLVVRAGVRNDAVIAWVEIVVDGDEPE